MSKIILVRSRLHRDSDWHCEGTSSKPDTISMGIKDAHIVGPLQGCDGVGDIVTEYEGLLKLVNAGK